MVCMVNKTAIAYQDSSALSMPSSAPKVNGSSFLNFFGLSGSKQSECYYSSLSYPRNLTASNFDKELDISKREQSVIFMSFYLGGLFILLPGSYLCDYFGPTKIVLYGAISNVLGTFMTPFIARDLPIWVLISVRFLMGCGQGILVPCMNVLISVWFPLKEKSTAVAIATTGNQISIIVAMFLTAKLCLIPWLGGWPWAFYIYGIIGLFFCFAWFIFACDSPTTSKRINKRELEFITSCEHTSQAIAGGKIDLKDVPWMKILSSKAVWASAICSFSQNYMNVGTVVYLPSYYSNVLHLNLSSNGIMSALPFLVQLFSKIIFASLADEMKKRTELSNTQVIKIFNLIGSIGAAICFFFLSFCDCRTPYLAIFLATSAVAISSGFIPGYNTSIVVIAPRYTSPVASFCRFLAQLASVAAPAFIGLIVTEGTPFEWSLANLLTAFILIISGIVFQLFGSGSVEKWAECEKPEKMDHSELVPISSSDRDDEEHY